MTDGLIGDCARCGIPCWGYFCPKCRVVEDLRRERELKRKARNASRISRRARVKQLVIQEGRSRRDGEVERRMRALKRALVRRLERFGSSPPLSVTPYVRDVIRRAVRWEVSDE